MQVYTKIKTLFCRYKNLGKVELPNKKWIKFQNKIILGDFSDDFMAYIKDLKYDCKYLIERDIKNILREAEESHKDTFDEVYDRNTLAPLKCRVYLDDNDGIVYLMIIYTVDYRDGKCKRTACGDYYPLCDLGTHHLLPHPYQASICW